MKKLDLILTVLLGLALAFSISLNYHLLLKQKHNTEMVQRVQPILEEMDTTYSLRNYEVMRVKLYNELKQWDAYEK